MPSSQKSRFKVEIVRIPEHQVLPGPNEDGTERTVNENLYNSERLYDEMTKENKNYICVDSHDTFEVKLIAAEPNDTQTYGAVLYLDGHRIPGKKTFRRVDKFPGFKKGKGKFQEFRFKVPKPSPGSTLLYPSPYTNAYKQLKLLQLSRF